MKNLSILLISIFLLACGGNNQSNSDASETKRESTPTADKTEVKSKVVEKEIIEITLIAKGETMTEIAFEPNSLSVPKNSRIKLTLKNESSTAGMLHNFVLVPLGAGEEIAKAGISAGSDNSFVPEDERVVINTKVLDIGEETTIEFDAPAQGSYHYICSFPGHYPNMIGRMNVQ